jgi:hypothetical protein
MYCQLCIFSTASVQKPEKERPKRARIFLSIFLLRICLARKLCGGIIVIAASMSTYCTELYCSPLRLSLILNGYNGWSLCTNVMYSLCFDGQYFFLERSISHPLSPHKVILINFHPSPSPSFLHPFLSSSRTIHS